MLSFYFLILLFVCKNTVRSEENGSDAKKPNIVIILADDVGTGDIPAYWNTSVVDMPHLDALGKKGVTFLDAHASPICAPSRYMLLSGNYAHQGAFPNGSWGLYENGNQFIDKQKSIAEVLRDGAGYHTHMAGKWHLGAKAPPYGINRTVFQRSRALSDSSLNWNLPLIQGPQDIGFDSSYVTSGGIQAPPYSFFRDGYLTTDSSNIHYWEKGAYHAEFGKSKIAKHPGEGDKSWDSSAYNRILVNETIDFIDAHLAETPSKPFFSYVALGAVHVPHSPPNYFLDGTPVKGEYPTRHLDMLLEMDKVVGSIVKHIEKRNIQEETIIIFASDNGGLEHSLGTTEHLSGGPLRGRKGSIYEGGHRIPMIMRYDNVFPQNAKRKHMVMLNDIYATICEIVGIEIPYGSAQNSISFAAYIKSQKNNDGRRRKLPTWVHENNRVKEEAVRFGKMKLIHNVFESSVQLYNLTSDQSESIDLSEDEKYSTLIANMIRKLKKIGPCPDDVVGKFQVYGRSNPKGCNWFQKKKTRCKNFIEGKKHCASICGHNLQFCPAV